MTEDILLAGGTAVTCVADEVLWPGDILIRDGRIAAIGPHLEADSARRIDVSGRIVMPGLVDTHRHTWQSIVRNIASDWTLDQYLVGLHIGLSQYFRPEDTYIGNLLGALEALDAGITTLLDWSHNLYTPSTRTRPSTRCAKPGSAPSSRTAAGRRSGAGSCRPVPHPETYAGSGRNTSPPTTGW